MNRKIRRCFAAMLALLMLLFLTACSGSSGGGKAPAERVGSYNLYEMTEEGTTFDNETLKMFEMEDLLLLELKEDGTGTLTSDGESQKIKWTDTKISASNGIESYDYTYQDGKITLEIDGTTAVLQKTDGKSNASLSTREEPSEEPESSEEPEPTAISEPADELAFGSELQQWWSGSWYGWYHQISAYGSWEDAGGVWYDCCAEITMEDNTTGTIRIWDETFSKDVPLAECEITFGPGTTSAGAFMSETGVFIDGSIEHADWIVDPGASAVSQYDHMICIDGSYEDPADEGGFDYMIYLRPWGMDWEDVAADDEELLPMHYEDWYLPLIQAGKDMPDELGS